MVEGQYTVSVKLNDREIDDAVKKIQDAFKNIEIQMKPVQKAAQKIASGGSGSGGEDGKKQFNLWQKIGREITEISKSSAALIGIGAGIGSLVAMITDASPILQNMLKLLQTGVMLILRPIGDFIGLLLRPLIIQFVRNVALPFYKQWTEFMPTVMEWGDALAEFFSDPVKSLKGLIEGINWNSLVDQVYNAFAQLFSFLDIGKFFSDVQKFVEEWFPNWNDIENAWNAVVDVFRNIYLTVKGAIESTWNVLVKVFGDIGSGIRNTVGGAWENLVGFFSGVYEDIVFGLESSWSGVTSFFGKLFDDISGTLSTAWNKFMDFWESVLNFIQGKGFAPDGETGGGAFDGISSAANDFWNWITGSGGSDSATNFAAFQRQIKPFLEEVGLTDVNQLPEYFQTGKTGLDAQIEELKETIAAKESGAAAFFEPYKNRTEFGSVVTSWNRHLKDMRRQLKELQAKRSEVERQRQFIITRSGQIGLENALLEQSSAIAAQNAGGTSALVAAGFGNTQSMIGQLQYNNLIAGTYRGALPAGYNNSGYTSIINGVSTNFLPKIFDWQLTDSDKQRISSLSNDNYNQAALKSALGLDSGAADFQLATGGVITEPIFGLGQRSGKTYTLGEHEAEHVIPQSKMGNGRGSITVNFHIASVNGMGDIMTIKTIFEQFLAEKVRRGMI